MFHDRAKASIKDPPRQERPTLPQLPQAQLHEVHADGADWAGALAFSLSAIEADSDDKIAGRPICVVRSHRRGAALVPCGEGLAESLGIDPGRLLIVDARDDATLLRAGLDAVRNGGPAAVLVESWGRCREYDMVASRRLVLAAETSGIVVVVLRGDAEPRPSAAHTRWTVTSAPSDALETRAPGAAALIVELVRRRGGPGGLVWRLEWNEEHGRFAERRLPADAGPFAAGEGHDSKALPGAVVSLPIVREGPAMRRIA